MSEEIFEKEKINPTKITAREVYSLIPQRARTSTKHDFGKLFAICGSSFYRGAAYLSCAGALRSGVGICTLASIEKVVSAVASSLPECTFMPVDESTNGTIYAYSFPNINEISKRYTALLIGCGLSIDESTKVIVENTIKEAECQLIIDADGLNILSEKVELLKEAHLPPVITPHFYEMARLCNTSVKNIEKEPEKIALEFAKEYNCIVVLKSHKTYVASYDGQIFVNTEKGNQGLAKGGSGDVLAGIISSLCAQKMSPVDAAKCGVYLHGEAADNCAERLSMQGMLPSDILTDLAKLF
ncbi:MAG: NAD(P)H-hydrate dehydratase [Clostridia bacterium]|nr:NAD(P)H-hydrate dehydratase [Clostridia bacterium]